MNLAFYGTLRDRDVLSFVTGDELEKSFHARVTVKGWACLRIEGETYPLLRSDPEATTVFHLYHDCSEVSWRRLVEYEGAEYGFIEVLIESEVYRVFMAENHVTASTEIWNLEEFQKKDKNSFLNELKKLATT